jgi:uncharacterized protein YoaH (UPF0181 family)
VNIPRTFADRALIVGADTWSSGEALARVAAEARRRGLNQLWLDDVPLEEGGAVAPERIAAAIAAGRSAGLPVFAVVRLLRAPEASPDEERDRNLLGETATVQAARLRADTPKGRLPPWLGLETQRWDWRRVGAPSDAAALARQLRTLAATPGLDGLALRDTAAPGYTDPGDRGDAGFRSGAPEFGYTPDLRLAFLRQEGFDPVDLLSIPNPVGSVRMELPFFPRIEFSSPPATGFGVRPGDSPLSRRWDALRYRANLGVLEAVFNALQGGAAGVARPRTVLIASRTDGGNLDILDWYGSWDKANALPHRRNRFDFGKPKPQAARSFSRRTLAYYPGVRDAIDPDVMPGVTARQLAAFLGSALEADKGPWDGFVLDLSEAADEGTTLALLGALAEVA